MPLVSQEVDNLLGGVSQQAVTQRDENQVEEQVNALLTIGEGNSKRPPSQHTAVLSGFPNAAYDSVHTHLVSRSATDRYRVVLSNGDLKVFDAVTGEEQTVEFPNGKDYLNTTDPQQDFRCVTVGETTYITNGSVTVLRDDAASDAARNEALLFVRASDYFVKYSVTINGVTLEYTTPDGSAPATDREHLQTELIASQFKTLIEAHPDLTAFDILQYGSTLYITRSDGADFSISAADGLGDDAIIAIKGTVQRFDLLPDRAHEGFTVEVTGDPTNTFDNYYVKYDSSLTPNLVGVWKETVKPGILTKLDTATMPHQLVRGYTEKQGLVCSGVPAPPNVSTPSGLDYTVTFDPSLKYPADYETVLQIDAAPPVSYSAAIDETGAQVALGLMALVNATGSYIASNLAPGVLGITTNPAGTPLTVSASYTWADDTHAFVPELKGSPFSLFGKTIRNVSDDSTGIVTGNTANVITVGALTGGGTNKFLKGDLIDVVSATTNLTFGPALWKPRVVGSIETAPFPSIVGKPVVDLFFVKNRLGLVSASSIVTSRVADHLNLFRESATQLLPTDPIDITSATQKTANFQSAIHWNDTLLLWASDAQFQMSPCSNDDQQPLSPETVGLAFKSGYTNSPRLRPVDAGDRLYFARGGQGRTQVFEYSIADESARATDITKHIPTYIAGRPIQLAVDPSAGLLAVLTDADQSKLYVLSYHYESQTLVQRAWSRWEFAPGTRIVSIDMLDGKLGLVVSRPGGVYLEVIDLDTAADSASIRDVRSLDRRVKGDAPGLVSSYVAPNVSWTLPYSIAVDGSEGSLVVARISTGQIVPSTRTGPTNVTVTGLGDIRSDCYIGVLYTWRTLLSTIMKRSVNRDGQTFVDTSGRLILRYLTAKFHDTTSFVAKVTIVDRTPFSYSPTAANELRFSVMSRNINASIELSDTSPGSVHIDGYSWEGNHETVTTRI